MGIRLGDAIYLLWEDVLSLFVLFKGESLLVYQDGKLLFSAKNTFEFIKNSEGAEMEVSDWLLGARSRGKAITRVFHFLLRDFLEEKEPGKLTALEGVLNRSSRKLKEVADISELLGAKIYGIFANLAAMKMGDPQKFAVVVSNAEPFPVNTLERLAGAGISVEVVIGAANSSLSLTVKHF